MARERRVSWDEVTLRARRLLDQHGPGLRYWGIPRGGNYVAAVLAGLGATVTTEAASADLAVDDILDSGRTAERIRGLHGIETVALFDKVAEGFDEWLVFPWEAELELDAHDTVTRLIQQIGDDPSRDGLRGTPERVVRGWAEQFSGYRQPVEDGAAAAGAPPGVVGGPVGPTRVVVVRGLEVRSTCEGHLQPFSGSLVLAYALDGRARDGGGIGAAQLAGVVETYARRLTTQQRLTAQVAEAIVASGWARAVLARSTAVHHCAGASRDCGAGEARTVEAVGVAGGVADAVVESQLREAMK